MKLKEEQFLKDEIRAKNEAKNNFEIDEKVILGHQKIEQSK